MMPDAVAAQVANGDLHSSSGSLRPAEVADALAVSPATLRRWSQRFEGYLQARDSSSDGSHRRYTARDVDTLRQIKARLEAGWTYEQVAQQLDVEARSSDSPMIDVLPDPTEVGEVGPSLSLSAESPQAMVAMAATDGRDALTSEGWPPAAQILRDALQAVSDNQLMLLNSQHANRDLMGVVIQDNLNLKDENTNLRDRMLELERELAEMRRRHTDFRERLETRVRVLEDAVATLMARQQAPSANFASSAPPSSYAPYPSQPERRGFWSRLLGG
jgi:DNA-binding transcriptional MerR regulator